MSIVIVILFVNGAGIAQSGPDPEAFLLSSIGSERATQGNGNKIVTVGKKTHVVWQDSTENGYFARIRTFGRLSGEWTKTWTLGKGEDNHARPTITVDSDHRLHAIIGGHHSGLKYRRSDRTNDASKWTDPEVFGKSTYPLLICGHDDTLYLTGATTAVGRASICTLSRPENSGNDVDFSSERERNMTCPFWIDLRLLRGSLRGSAVLESKKGARYNRHDF